VSAVVVRQPKQQRSRQRVERLIEAADEVLAAEGYGALTVRRIAEAARVPVGSIYQFFADKHAIVEVLAQRYMDEFASLMTQLMDDAGEDRWDDPAGTVIDAFTGLFRIHGGYRAIWLDRHLTPEMVRADERNDDLMAEGLRRMLVTQGTPDSDQLAFRCRVAVYMGGSLLRRAFRADPAGDPALIEETKRIERMYLSEITG
jgi:AcrR family transcriptional regulator